MSRELTLIVDSRVDKLAERLEALEAKLDKTIGLLLRHGDLIGRQACRNDSALQEAADIETRVNELEDHIGARIDALYGLMGKIAHPLAAVALKDPMAAAAILDGS